MNVSQLFGDLISQFSVTGLLKERLELVSARADFELLKASTLEAELRAEILRLNTALHERDAELAKLTAELALTVKTRDALKLELERERIKLRDLYKITPDTVLETGAALTLAGLFHAPAGCLPMDCFRDRSFPVRLADVMCWINEFRDHGWVVGAEGEMFKMTDEGRRFARDYFASHG
jgi:hypothetical protein